MDSSEGIVCAAGGTDWDPILMNLAQFASDLSYRITARIDDAFEKKFPRVVRMRLIAKDRAGKSYEVNIVNPLGHEDNPVSARELAMKFERLCEPRLGRPRTAAALELRQNIETAADTADGFDALDVQAVPG